MSDPIRPPENTDENKPQPPAPSADRPNDADIREGTIDFDYTLRSGQGGTSTLNLGKVPSR